jgi:hypothetical protein
MKTWMSFLALSFLTLNVAFAGPTVQSFGPEDVDYLDPSVVSNKTLAVKVEKIDGFSGASLEKMQRATQVLQQVVNSETFKSRVINFKNTKGERAFASNKGLSNEQIFEIFMEGRETLQPDTAGVMNFYLSLYNAWWSRVIGWTNGDINTININWKFFKNFQPNEVAGNLAHEWTHKIGFDHTSAAEHDSAPYAIGYIVDELAAKVLQGQKIK